MRTIAFVVLLLVPIAVFADPDAPLEKTLAPYFVVEGAAEGVDPLPLKSTHVDVAVTGVVAEVMITQTYANEGATPIHARYVFPASTRAAVHAMRMIVGEQVITAKIKERAQAEKEFKAAKEAGKSASLLTQERPNVFTMNVSNVLPGDTIRVELSYTELLVPTDGVYSFVFPTVVGPRYSHTLLADATPVDQFIVTPYLHENQPSPMAFTLQATIAAGLPIQRAGSPSHRIRFLPGSEMALEIDSHFEKNPANRDFILEYALAQDKVASGVMLYEHGDEKYFLLMAEPPKRTVQDMVTPREYIFVLDVSGSMYGFPLDTAKTLMRRLFADLRPYERFNVVLFSGRAATLSETSMPATDENLQAAMRIIDNQRGGGGTELCAALQTAFALPKTDGVARSMIVVTDGYIAEESEAFDFIRDHLNATNVFSFGIGSAVNRHLIEGVARAGMGEPFVITKPEEANASAERFREYIASPVLTGLTLQGDGVELYDMEPKTIPDVFASRPVVVTGKYRGNAKGALSLRGYTAGGSYDQHFAITKDMPSPKNRALRQLWARSRLTTLADFGRGNDDQDTRAQIVNIGLGYSLLTKYTSFIAVHERMRTNAAGTDVTQPLPLPEGVSDNAVGVTNGSEPELVILLLVVAIAFVLGRRRARGVA